MNITRKEHEIMALVATGMKDKDIAKAMRVSVRTIQNHLARLYTKLGTDGRVGALVVYLGRGLQIVTRRKKAQKARAAGK